MLGSFDHRETTLRLHIPTLGVPLMEARGWKPISVEGDKTLMEKSYSMRLILETLGECLSHYSHTGKREEKEVEK